jgi:serine/threonine protein phosphatase 1
MFAWLKPKTPIVAAIADGQVVYAVGDLHGMAGLTKAMIARLLEDARQFPNAKPHLIFLGDYVDKGDHSNEVIAQLIELSRNPDVACTFIKGNHEDALLTFLENPMFGPQWLAYGGGPTLQSYGVNLPSGRITPDSWEGLADSFRAALPAEHLTFFRGLPTSLSLGGYFFVHAGIRPGRPLDNQEDGDLMWIRHQFLDDRRALPAVIVHGHSPDLEPYRDHRRIGIDTGAYATGRLSAVRLRGSAVEMISVKSPIRSD